MDALGSATDARIGSLVEERYKILESMAAGSMGVVYKAERVPVGKLVAIKFLHKSFANDSEFLIRFERETRVMSKLAHPNCVSVVDFGVWEDSPYLVMEYVAGTTLRNLLDDGPLSPLRALGLMRQIVSGLAHAHSHEIVHRDIKPANIMISDEIGTGEHVRILDFGLARLRTGGGRDATQNNVVVGTPNYMAPEQTVGGGAIDARTDIYAAGVVLFEMLAGERPFIAEETMQLLGMHRAAKIPRLAERAPNVELPEGVQAIVDRAMAKKPADRFQTAIEFAQAIDEIIDPRPAELKISGSRPVRRKTDPAIAPTLTDVSTDIVSPLPDRARWKSPMIGALILLVGIGAATGYLLYRNAQDHSVATPADAPKVAATLPADAQTVDAAPPDAALDAPDDAVVPDDAGAEIEMDPEKAEDLDPSKEVTAQDEDPNAPASKADVEKQAPPAPPALATNIHDAILLIKDGKRELALASLYQLERENPKSAYIPFLQGNLYFDKLWWSVAMEHYQAAIHKNAGYKSNPTLIRNVIKMLASPKTQRSAGAFLRSIGHPAAGLLRAAAKSDPNPIIKKQAALLARTIR